MSARACDARSESCFCSVLRRASAASANCSGSLVSETLGSKASTRIRSALTRSPNSASQRANALLARDSCYTITSGATDDLGVLPATGPCDQVPGSLPRHVGDTTIPPAGNTLPAQVPAPPQTRSGGATPVTSQAVPNVPVTTFATPPVVPLPVVGAPPLVSPIPTPPITITLPLPLPPLNVPALLPGLPALRIGD